MSKSISLPKSIYPEQTVSSRIYTNYDKLLAIPSKPQQSAVTQPNRTSSSPDQSVWIVRLLIVLFMLTIITVTLSFVSSSNKPVSVETDVTTNISK